MGALHHWWPKMTGRMYPEKPARWSVILVFLGFNVTFFTQFVLGSRGMPRRYYNYLDQFQPLHAFSTFGSWLIGAGFRTARRHPRTRGAGAAWSGRRSRRPSPRTSRTRRSSSTAPMTSRPRPYPTRRG
jgi:hypothetical protein